MTARVCPSEDHTFKKSQSPFSLPRSVFCDDSLDCPDGSDENLCDARNDPNRAAECDPRLCRFIGFLILISDWNFLDH